MSVLEHPGDSKADGRWIGTKYELLRELGKGGTGTVYLARDAELERVVALKVLHPHLSQHETFLQSFRAEARMLAKIRDPRIVTIHSFSSADGLVMLDMEYIEGRPLHQILRTEPMSERAMVDVLHQLLDVIGACHRRGIIHCDLKPSNLILAEDGCLHVVDFGWARALTESANGAVRHEDHFLGTPAYAPPEAWKGATPAAAWDLYSIGAIAFTMFTGRPPHSSVESAFERLESDESTSGHWMIPWLRRLLAEQPADRYPSAEEARNGLPTGPRLHVDVDEVTVVRTLKPVSAKQRTGKGALVLLAVLGLVAVLGAVWPEGPPPALSGEHPTLPVAPKPTLDGAPQDMAAGANGIVYFTARADGRERELLMVDVRSGSVSPVALSGPLRLDEPIHYERFSDGVTFAHARSAETHHVWRLPLGDEKPEMWRLLHEARPGQHIAAVQSVEDRPVVSVRDESSGLDRIFTAPHPGAPLQELGAITLPHNRNSLPPDRFAFLPSGALLAASPSRGGLARISPDSAKVDWILPETYQVYFLKAWNGTVWAVVEDGICGMELWTSDGTPGGTRLFRDIRAGAHSAFSPYRDYTLVPLKDALVFAARDNSHGLELWSTDGTQAGTRILRDIDPGPSDSDPYGFKISGDTVYFSATSRQHGRELWRTSGTVETTALVVDANPGFRSGEPYAVTPANGRVYFSAQRHDVGEELWVVDVASNNARVVDDIYPGPKSSEPYDMASIGSGVLFAATHPDAGRELFFSDGSADGTRLLVDLWRERDLEATPPGKAKSAALFAQEVEGLGMELCRMDVETGEALMVSDIYPGSGSSHPKWITRHDDVWYFSADDGVHGRELWRSDGTAPGTFMVFNGQYQDASSNPRHIVSVEESLYFVMGAYGATEQLCVLDFGNRNALVVLDSTGITRGGFSGFRTLGDSLYFTATAGDDQSWLCRVRSGSTLSERLRLLDGPPGP